MQYKIALGNILLAATGPAHSDAQERLFTGEKSECSSARTIQKNLAETEFDPIPKQ